MLTVRHYDDETVRLWTAISPVKLNLPLQFVGLAVRLFSHMRRTDTKIDIQKYTLAVRTGKSPEN